MNELSFNFMNKTYEIRKTKHLLETREKSYVERSRFITDNILKDVLIYSFSRGFSSFRDRGVIVISYFNDKKIQTSILVKIDSDNKIVIISMFYEYRPRYLQDNFIKCKNRIYLDKIFNSVSREEFRENKRQKSIYEIEKICAEEDSIFERYAKKLGMNGIK